MATALLHPETLNVSCGESPLVTSNFQSVCAAEGGTVKNVLDPSFVPLEGFRWYVLQVNYGKEREAAAALRQMGFVAYVPTHTIKVEREGRQVEETHSWLPNTLFLYCSVADVRQFRRTTIPVQGLHGTTAAQISFKYDHTQFNRYGLNLQMTVPFADMMSFIRLVEMQDRNVTVLQSEEQVSRIGEEVEITDGRFRGIHGRVARFRKSDIVLVQLSGVCLVTTAYVPKAFLRPYRKSSKKKCQGSATRAKVPQESQDTLA